MSGDEKIYCENPAPGKKGTNIPRWKYDLLRQAVLAALGEAGTEGIGLSELKEAVGTRLSDEDKERLGSLSWHLMSVKLHMEVIGEVKRISAKGRQRLIAG